MHKKLYRKISSVLTGKPKRKKKDGCKDKEFVESLVDGPLPKMPSMKRTMSNSESQLDYMEGFHVNSEKVHKVVLSTPGRPDHTYSSVAFNVHALPGGAVVKVNGFSVGGELGRMRVYICIGELCHSIREDKSKWDLIYDKRLPNSMRRNSDILFEQPVLLGPEQTCAFYIHSDRHNDRGLKYRSCRRSVVHVDDSIAITKGFAHTSPIPFNQMGGWYRENRVLSGVVYYEAIPIIWTNFCHYQFPMQFQHAVIVIRHVLCEEREWSDDLVDIIIPFLPYDWFGLETGKKKFLKSLQASTESAAKAPFGRPGFW